MEDERVECQLEQFEFAWAWPNSEFGLPSVLEWFHQKLEIPGDDLSQILEVSGKKDQAAWLCDYYLILLDLAWSSKAEKTMGKMQLLPTGTGYQMANSDTEHFQELCQKVEGIQFLEWWRKLENPKPDVWVTSAYLPITAWEIRGFIKSRYDLPMYHKWLDEDLLQSDISDFQKQLDISKIENQVKNER
ncbi:MAG: hypothetical protein WBA93_34665 [Microcoleaceae cyanobacterium]